MKLTVLGSGTACFSLQRFPSAYLLEACGQKVLLDGGSGTARRLLQSGVPPEELDIIAYSHLHPDHTGELVPLLFAFRSPSRPRKKKLTLLGPPNFPSFFEKLQSLYRSWIEPTYPFELLALEKPTELQGILFTPFPVLHMAHSIAYRISAEGKTLAYSGDSGYCSGLVAACQDADLAICECSFPDALQVPTHMTPRLCQNLLREAHPKLLLLSHFYPEVEAELVQEPFGDDRGKKILLAEDFTEVTL